MKKILLLGGSAQQIIAIETAKKLGYWTILCDYLSDNPGQYVADTFYLASTTDKEAILAIAKQEHIDGILAYASDPAAPTAAYVAEELGLSGNPYRSVEILCNKDYFRRFLAENGFSTPVAKGYKDIEEALREIKEGAFRFPIIIKPVDSSGSRGVARCDTYDEAWQKMAAAMGFSKSGRIIIEEFVEKQGYQVAGDGLSIDGTLVFRCFANDHFDPRCTNPFVPIAASFPYNMPEEVQDRIHAEIQRLLTLLGMRTCTYNFDIRIGRDGNVYLMEIAPRDGGNYIPQVIRHATGINLVEYAIRGAMGEKLDAPEEDGREGYWAYYSIHSLRGGVLDRIEFAEGIEKNHIVENHITCLPGDTVEAFTRANSTLGCLVMKFESMDQMLDMMANSERWVNVGLRV